MSDEARRFRQRAYDCRELAKVARDVRDRQLLDEIADDLDDEANRIEGEDEAMPNDD
jgi:hypothetical protein